MGLFLLRHCVWDIVAICWKGKSLEHTQHLRLAWLETLYILPSDMTLRGHGSDDQEDLQSCQCRISEWSNCEALYDCRRLMTGKTLYGALYSCLHYSRGF